MIRENRPPNGIYPPKPEPTPAPPRASKDERKEKALVALSKYGRHLEGCMGPCGAVCGCGFRGTLYELGIDEYTREIQ